MNNVINFGVKDRLEASKINKTLSKRKAMNKINELKKSGKW